MKEYCHVHAACLITIFKSFKIMSAEQSRLNIAKQLFLEYHDELANRKLELWYGKNFNELKVCIRFL